MNLSQGAAVTADTTFGFLDAAAQSDRLFHPLLVSNEGDNTMLHAIKSELARSQSFVFSVAFVTTDALAVLKQALLDFRGRGTIITSTYLGFNSPDMFRELAGLADKIGVYVHNETKRFHAKGYVFTQDGTTTAIVGSSNLTSNALLRNREWNLRFSALPDGDITSQLRDATERQLADSTLLSRAWIDAYAASYVVPTRAPLASVPTIELPAEHIEPPVVLAGQVIPNAMQRDALDSVAEVREAGERRAVVISATGTGKTILAALDVRAFRPQRMLFVVHREQILDRAIEEFQRVLGEPSSAFGKFVGERREFDRKYVFATVQSLTNAGNLEAIDPEHFDYILIDEVHRAGARSYRRVIDHFTPTFLLGVTATPERTDDFNVYELFDYNVPYEIRLQAALEAEMLVPFHYYGVTDATDADGYTIDATTDLPRLVADERVDHLIAMIERYGHTGQVRGLMFCSRRDEAAELSRLLNTRFVNGKLLRTRVLTGSDSVPTRNALVDELERAEIDYILTVDVFNEGIDIPTVNQVVMLRQTQSSIIFTQQLGRGLRKAAGKDHLRVIDFIGNYQNNFLIPIALLGDSSLNKDVIRKKLIRADSAGTIAGLSSINFDEIARERVLRSLAATKLDAMTRLKREFTKLSQRLGRPPRLIDFARFDTVDPVVIGTKHRNYWTFLTKAIKDHAQPSAAATARLDFLTRELLNGKRPQELLVLRSLLRAQGFAVGPMEDHSTGAGVGESASVPHGLGRESIVAMLAAQACRYEDDTIDSVARILALDFFTVSERSLYGGAPLVSETNGRFVLDPDFIEMLATDAELLGHVEDVIETGLYLARHRYSWTGDLEPGHLYSRKDVCRMLNWHSNEYSTIYGYKVDRESRSCPIFVTYHKGDEVSESTRYEDEFLDPSTMRWFTRSRRTLASAEVRAIVDHEVPLHLFAKKDDAEGSDFYYLGRARSQDAQQERMPGAEGTELDVVTMKLGLESPVEEGLYDYLVNATSESNAPTSPAPAT